MRDYGEDDSGEQPAVDPVERAQRYDWNTVATEAEAVYRRVADPENEPAETEPTPTTSP